MGRFKKQFWSGAKRDEHGDLQDIPEPEWYARQYDPTDRVTQSSGHKVERNPRPEGALIPRAMVGETIMPIKDAFNIYRDCNCEDFRLNYPNFKIALIKGSTFRTTKGVVSKPKES